eukprot:Seg555.7 transcript_id=Seg555.7/GoldUCD/mRNA.D3Y31 product="NEDD8-activating enzyme E1 catalytic subunit" protein_id=Seg555.7/GoldUCD/D3Y31
MEVQEGMVEENISAEDSMAVDQSNENENCGRWKYLRYLAERGGPLADPQFEADENNFKFFRENAKILVIGAGGLGCELLKDLALMGFVNIEVIDMDRIDLSNLNRQFLFRPHDVNRPKAVVAAEFVNNRVQGCRVVPHFNKIQDKDEAFYSSFNIVVCGLDSIVARRWINGMLHSLVQYDEDGNVLGGIIPFVDGGTEGFKGNARVIIPGMTACIECNLDLFPPQVTFPMCTIAQTPRLPEHCIEYVKVIQWPQEQPFGENVAIDGDDPVHVEWIFKESFKRAEQFNIRGVTYRLTQGVIKNIIPAVASTNAVIAAICANEVFKLATSCYALMNNYMVFNDTQGIYTYTFEIERKDDCSACSQKPFHITMKQDAILQNLIDHLSEDSRTTVQLSNDSFYMDDEDLRFLPVNAVVLLKLCVVQVGPPNFSAKSLLFAQKLVFLKWAYFWPKAQGLTLLFAKKSLVSKKGLFLAKSKGVNLTFCRKIGSFEKGLIWAKSKGVNLTFCRKIGSSKKGIIWGKGKGVNLTFCRKIGSFEKGLIWAKSKGVNLTFPRKIGSFEKGLIWGKIKGDNLTFCRKIGSFEKVLFLAKKQRG